MSLTFEDATYITPVNLVEIETEFATTTSFKGATNTFSSYPVINVVDNENPTQPYQVTSKKKLPVKNMLMITFRQNPLI